jgi:tripartite-type tricarboxylate transporter receptor subunit TctC
VLAGTPVALVVKISADIRNALNDPASEASLALLGADYAASTPGGIGAVIRAEVERWAPVIRAANIGMS